MWRCIQTMRGCVMLRALVSHLCSNVFIVLHAAAPGACGQLVIDYNKGQQGCGKSSSGAVTDIEDLGRGRVAVAGS